MNVERPKGRAVAVQTEIEPAAGTLFAMIGGMRTISLIVDRLYARVLADACLAPAFAGVEMGSIKRAQTRFLTRALGGAVGPGRDDVVVWVEPDELSRMVTHLWDTLLALGMPAELLDEVLVAIFRSSLEE